MKIHASTQMSLNNYYSVLWAKENGISRVIFPREISIDEISKIHTKLKENNKELELEVFAHGALCYSISGKCYISSLNNGRSGNRGACTQPCRREYILKYKGHKVSDGYLLSTHDLNLSDDLNKLAKSGINSIKLEGRMKSEDYVGTIVNSYRNILDKKEGSFKDDLNFVFNRKFTKGYIMNQSPSEVMGRESSGHLGLYIGDIVAINREYPEIFEKKQKFQAKIVEIIEIEKNSKKNKNNKNNNNTNNNSNNSIKNINNSNNINNIENINNNNNNNNNNRNIYNNSNDVENSNSTELNSNINNTNNKGISNNNNNIQERKKQNC